MEIKVYSTKNCPNCIKLKKFLQEEGVAYEEVDMGTAEALTELRMGGVFTLTAPVLQIGSVFLTYNDLFNGEQLKKERIKEVISRGNEEPKEV
ncbi:MAG: glutaredoxin family protein [Candidatus Methanospirareceae archaeon]